ncbi:20S proteasome subunit beta [Ceratobasidium theobromae]|uniref:Proteasome subunit beta n=1 Tax=Ceratobasidium theobromae TaxID=1582974 RepID=A0A5N5QC52_9AGAM|nr:20S proteasome subunit beta [Ceratobasidium theobromae]
MDYFPVNWREPRTDEVHPWYGPSHHARPQPKHDAFAEGVQRTQQPIVTGTSVLGIRYKDGVMLAADNLASYGSLARFKDIRRLHPVGDYTENDEDDGHDLGPSEIYEFLSRVMYSRRSKFDPLWNSIVVGGYKDGKSLLGYVDLLGTTYSASTISTGYGSMIAIPLLRKAVEGREDTLTEEEGKDILIDCMKVLFYRDARSLNKFQIATVTASGINISESMEAPTVWGFAKGIRGYGGQTQ